MKRMGGGAGENWHLIAQKGSGLQLDVGLDCENKVSDLLEETFPYLVIK